MARCLVPIMVVCIAGLGATEIAFAQQQQQEQQRQQELKQQLEQQQQQRQLRSEPRDPSTPTLFDPHFDSGRSQQFRRPGQPARPTPVATPSSGAGATGYDATNARVNRRRKEEAQRRARSDAANLPPIAATAPDRTVAPVFQRQESLAAQRRRATNSAPIPLDAAGVVAARPIRKRLAEEDPFGAVGVYHGSFLFKPAVEFLGGYNSNPGQRLNGKGSSFEKVAPELSIKSDWSRHELSADLKGSYIWYNDNDLQNLSKPDIDLKAKGRIDITKQTQAEFEGKFALLADNPGDPNLPTDVSTPPLYIAPGGSARIKHTLNRLELSLKGSIDRTAYGDATLNNGELLDLRDRNYNQYGITTRAAYEIKPGIKPFVEYGSDQRRHDRVNDTAGVARDSNGRQIKAGSEFELTGYLTGEASIGMFERVYMDPTFPNISGMLYDASLTYYPTPLTTLKLNVKTGVDESILPGVAGALRHDYGLQIDHAFRRWLIGTVTLGFGTDDYEGSDRDDKRYIVGGALLWKLSREIHFKAEARREWLKSTVDGQDYTSNIVTVGLRLQR